MTKYFLRKLLFCSLLVGWGVSAFGFALAQEKIELNFFFSPTCPRCTQAKEFLPQLQAEYPQLEVKSFNVFEQDGVVILKNFYSQYQVAAEDQGRVPVIFVKERYFVGFNNQTAQDIEQYLRDLITSAPQNRSPRRTLAEIISAPILGKIDTANFSPLVLSALLGFLDGFNACAMVALGFLLAILVSEKNRRRVLIIGGTFIFISGAVYFLFITAWLNLFLYLAHIKFIVWGVAGVVIVFAIIMLRDYFWGVVCRVCQIEPKKSDVTGRSQKWLLGKMQRILTSPIPLPLTLLGVVAVAIGINMIELFCSIGLPLAFTKTLTAWQMPKLAYYLYLAVYIFFYMLDDLLIFLLALWTLRITRASERYLKVIKLISGIVLLILGLLMLIKPEFLTLGR